MHNKRGIEVTFSWVFSIIAGAVIFLFFVGFAAENMDLFGKLTAIRVSEEMNSAFTGLKTGLVSTSLSFNKEIKLQFKCIDGEREKLIVGYRSGKNLYDNIVFSPETLEGNEFLLMTKSWNVPYKVDNFIFISDNRDYCLKDAPIELRNKLPSNFEDLLGYNGVNCNGKNINFLRDANNCSDPFTINYGYDSINNLYGSICGEDGKPLLFYGDAMIYAAIFGDQFNCLYPLMEEKLKIMSEVYASKASGNMKNNIGELSNLNKIDDKYEIVKTQNEALIGAGGNAIF